MKFSKMQSLGNDFVIIDNIKQNLYFSSDNIRYLADRHYGIGCDQLLLVEPSINLNIDFYYRIFNSNGNEVFQCGNGARCLALFLHMKNLTDKNKIHVSTRKINLILVVNYDNSVCVDMNEPIFEFNKILDITSNIEKNFNIDLIKQIILCGVVFIGNPHCVMIIQDIKNAPIQVLGPFLENYTCFPEKANIGFMQIINRGHIYLRVYERDIGETKACGSGACAAVSIGIQCNLLDEYVKVDLPGGELLIHWKGIGHSLYMTGPATHVYDGTIDL